MTDSTDPGRGDEGFSDPTAPTWSAPEPPVAPPSPYAAPAPGPAPAGTDPWVGQYPASAPSLPPLNPYAAPAPGQTAPPPPPPYGQAPYGQHPYGQAPYGQDPYGQPAYGQPPYALPYGAPRGNNTSAVVLTVVSGIATFLCCGFGIPSLVLGIIALARQSNDPLGAARMARYGWVTFGVAMVLGVGLLVALGVSGSFDTSTSTDFGGY